MTWQRWEAAAAAGLAAAVVAAAGVSCDEGEPPADERVYTEEREPCADYDPARTALWGDLHAHTGFSFDAWGYGNHHRPGDAYAFARGEALDLPPHDGSPDGSPNGSPPRTVQLERPLDFAMVSDHGEFLGEVELCANPDSVAYDDPQCASLRADPDDAALIYGTHTALDDPQRLELCADGTTGCIEDALRVRWEALQADAEAYYDRTAACAFVTFVGYEFTATPGVSNNHRNVVFRNAAVPALPTTYYGTQTAEGLWDALERDCLDAGTGCDVLTIAHNTNLSNGTMFTPDTTAGTLEQQRAAAERRARLEPLLEVFQHKGDMECRNGFDGADDDPLCGDEKQWPADADDCGDDTGAGGMRLWGCVSRRDFARGILREGLAEHDRLGVDPYAVGLLASTDTHNSVAGWIGEDAYAGHIGLVDDTPEERLGEGTITHDTRINNPGGLAGVWATERSRDAIFEALRRREVFGTSGPRIPVRLFGGWDLPDSLCATDDRAAQGYLGGVPMGAVLPAPDDYGEAPRFAVWATADPGTADHPNPGLQRIQIVKGWLDVAGTTHERVFDVAGAPALDLPPDPGSCTPAETGLDSLCAVWQDPFFDPDQRAFYYARVVQVPTCRWSAWECLRLPMDEPIPYCVDPEHRTVIQERAWSSPIWFEPAGG